MLKMKGNLRLSGKGKENQEQTREDYSTEQSCGCCGGRVSAYQTSTRPCGQEEQSKVGGEQNQQELCAVQIDDAEGEDTPGNQDKKKRKSCAITGVFNGAYEDFDGVEKNECGQGEQGEADPARLREPGFGDGQVEPSRG